MSRVLITGHNGYIGSVMAPIFIEAGHDVAGLDTEYFGACSLVEDGASFPAVRKDLRDLESSDLEGFDAVVHLAALSNDPIGNLSSRWTEEINLQSSVRLAELAKQAGVDRLLFSSSCIMYGMSEAAVVDEDSPLDPKTVYARSKVDAERQISALAGDGFSPVVPAQRHGLRPVATDALRHRLQRLHGLSRDQGQGHGVQRRQALASGGPRPGRVACLPRRARSAEGRHPQ